MTQQRPFEPLESSSKGQSSASSFKLKSSAATALQQKIGFDRLMFQRLGRILGIIFQSPPHPPRRLWSSPAFGIYLGLIAVACGYQAAAYYIGIYIPQFYTVFLNKDVTGFRNLILALLGLIVGASTAKGLTSLLGGYFALVSRKALVYHMHAHYVSDPSLYQVIYREKERIDNPDQRVTQDVDKFTLSVRFVFLLKDNWIHSIEIFDEH
jgi:ATP-binding cassette subfamily D (ALD) protein 4